MESQEKFYYSSLEDTQVIKHENIQPVNQSDCQAIFAATAENYPPERNSDQCSERYDFLPTDIVKEEYILLPSQYQNPLAYAYTSKELYDQSVLRDNAINYFSPESQYQRMLDEIDTQIIKDETVFTEKDSGYICQTDVSNHSLIQPLLSATSANDRSPPKQERLTVRKRKRRNTRINWHTSKTYRKYQKEKRRSAQVVCSNVNRMIQSADIPASDGYQPHKYLKVEENLSQPILISTDSELNLLPEQFCDTQVMGTIPGKCAMRKRKRRNSRKNFYPIKNYKKNEIKKGLGAETASSSVNRLTKNIDKRATEECKPQKYLTEEENLSQPTLKCTDNELNMLPEQSGDTQALGTTHGKDLSAESPEQCALRKRKRRNSRKNFYPSKNYNKNKIEKQLTIEVASSGLNKVRGKLSQPSIRSTNNEFVLLPEQRCNIPVLKASQDQQKAKQDNLINFQQSQEDDNFEIALKASESVQPNAVSSHQKSEDTCELIQENHRSKNKGAGTGMREALEQRNQQTNNIPDQSQKQTRFIRLQRRVNNNNKYINELRRRLKFLEIRESHRQPVSADNISSALPENYFDLPVSDATYSINTSEKELARPIMRKSKRCYTNLSSHKNTLQQMIETLKKEQRRLLAQAKNQAIPIERERCESAVINESLKEHDDNFQFTLGAAEAVKRDNIPPITCPVRKRRRRNTIINWYDKTYRRKKREKRLYATAVEKNNCIRRNKNDMPSCENRQPQALLAIGKNLSQAVLKLSVNENPTQCNDMPVLRAKAEYNLCGESQNQGPLEKVNCCANMSTHNNALSKMIETLVVVSDRELQEDNNFKFALKDTEAVKPNALSSHQKSQDQCDLSKENHLCNNEGAETGMRESVEQRNQQKSGLLKSKQKNNILEQSQAQTRFIRLQRRINNNYKYINELRRRLKFLEIQENHHQAVSADNLSNELPENYFDLPVSDATYSINKSEKEFDRPIMRKSKRCYTNLTSHKNTLQQMIETLKKEQRRLLAQAKNQSIPIERERWESAVINEHDDNFQFTLGAAEAVKHDNIPPITCPVRKRRRRNTIINWYDKAYRRKKREKRLNATAVEKNTCIRRNRSDMPSCENRQPQTLLAIGKNLSQEVLKLSVDGNPEQCNAMPVLRAEAEYNLCEESQKQRPLEKVNCCANTSTHKNALSKMIETLVVASEREFQEDTNFKFALKDTEAVKRNGAPSCQQKADQCDLSKESHRCNNKGGETRVDQRNRQKSGFLKSFHRKTNNTPEEPPKQTAAQGEYNRFMRLQKRISNNYTYINELSWRLKFLEIPENHRQPLSADNHNIAIPENYFDLPASDATYSINPSEQKLAQPIMRKSKRCYTNLTSHKNTLRQMIETLKKEQSRLLAQAKTQAIPIDRERCESAVINESFQEQEDNFQLTLGVGEVGKRDNIPPITCPVRKRRRRNTIINWYDKAYRRKKREKRLNATAVEKNNCIRRNKNDMPSCENRQPQALLAIGKNLSPAVLELSVTENAEQCNDMPVLRTPAENYLSEQSKRIPILEQQENHLNDQARKDNVPLFRKDPRLLVGSEEEEDNNLQLVWESDEAVAHQYVPDRENSIHDMSEFTEMNNPLEEVQTSLPCGEFIPDWEQHQVQSVLRAAEQTVIRQSGQNLRILQVIKINFQ